MTGRPRQFEEHEALRRVMQTFWRSGFEGANFDRLVAESGLSRSSLYNAFGGKDDLIEKSLELYVREEMGPFLESMQEADGREERLAAFIEGWREPYDSKRHRCLFGRLLLHNAASEGRPRHLKLVSNTLERLWAGFRSLVARGRGKRATVRRATSLTDEEAAAVLVAMQFGVMVLARNGKNEEIVNSITEGAKKLFAVNS